MTNKEEKLCTLINDFLDSICIDDPEAAERIGCEMEDIINDA